MGADRYWENRFSNEPIVKMYAYVFERLGRVSTAYHPEGGLVILAYDREQAKGLVAQYNADLAVEGNDDPAIVIPERAWDTVLELPLAKRFEERIVVFPNAGCC